MKASEAKALTIKNNTDSNSEAYQEVMTLIKKSINRGEYNAFLSKVINGDLRKQLESDGYKVTVFSDQRDGDSTTISWG